MVRSAKRFTYYECDGFELWGQEYQDSAGTVTWRLACLLGSRSQDRNLREEGELTVNKLVNRGCQLIAVEEQDSAVPRPDHSAA
jgi:hypothetical protein